MPTEKCLIDVDRVIFGMQKVIDERTDDKDTVAYKTFEAVISALKKAPTVDAVEVVRCKDCDWYRKDGSICVNPKCGKSWYGCRVPEQHFCSYGERRDGE